MSTEIITVSHLAKRAIEDRTKFALDAERNDDGTWDICMDVAITTAVRAIAEEKNITPSDAIIYLFRKKS